MLPSRVAALRARAQLVEEGMWPCEIIIGELTIPASRQAQAEGLSLAALGVAQEDKPVMFRVRKSFLADPPTPEQTLLTCEGIEFVVGKVEGQSELSPAWLLTCNVAGGKQR